MSIPDLPLPAHWQYYLDRSRETDVRPLDDLGRGCEEQLWEILTFIESGEPFTEDARRRLDGLPRNRAKKYGRVRRHLAAKTSPAGPGETPAITALITSDSVERVRAALSAEQWDIEWRLARGQTFAEVAREYDVGPKTLMMRASRWREGVRSRVAG